MALFRGAIIVKALNLNTTTHEPKPTKTKNYHNDVRP